MKVKETLKIIVDKHPQYKELNKRLIEDVKRIGYSLSYQTNVNARMTDWFSKSDSIDVVNNWVIGLIHEENKWINKPGNTYAYSKSRYTLISKESWFAGYNKGDYTRSHNHIPSHFSYVYFVKCPRGSSPLVFTDSGKRIKAEEGKVVIFPAIMNHHVPKSRCEDRIVLAGNFEIKSIGFW